MGLSVVSGIYNCPSTVAQQDNLFIAANISLPPMIPFIIYLSYVLGGYMMGDGSWAVDVELSISGVKGNLVQYLIGAVGLSCIAGLIAGALSYMLLVLLKGNR